MSRSIFRQGFATMIAILGLLIIPLEASAATVQWYNHGDGWKTVGGVKPPPCPPYPILQTPMPVTQASSVLYPGQVRGGEFKIHGGFRFSSSRFPTNNVTVRMPITAQLVRAARLKLLGEIQYHFEFTAPCGLHFWYGHVLNPSPKFKAIADKLPIPPENTTKFTDFRYPQTFLVGEVVARNVGFKKNTNVFFDFGLLDIRHRNAESKNPYYAATYKQFDPYGVCMFNYFRKIDTAYLKMLPGADQTAGKTSIYCH